MVFTRHKIESNTLGDLLRRTRQSRNLGLKDIEAKTDISVKYLELLEADDFYKLPSLTYIRGSLSLYADFLGLNSQEIIKRFEKEFNQLSNLSDSKNHSRPKDFLTAFFQKGLNPKVIFLSLVVLLILFYLGFNIKKVLSTPQVEIINPPNDLITKNSTLVVEGRAEPSVSIFINNQAIDQIDGYFKEKIELLPGLNTIEISGQKRYSKKKTIYRQVVLETDR